MLDRSWTSLTPIGEVLDSWTATGQVLDSLTATQFGPLVNFCIIWVESLPFCKMMIEFYITLFGEGEEIQNKHNSIDFRIKSDLCRKANPTKQERTHIA